MRCKVCKMVVTWEAICPSCGEVAPLRPVKGVTVMVKGEGPQFFREIPHSYPSMPEIQWKRM